MALKFRGNSQIRNASINLSKIKDVEAGTIIGRPSGIGSGDASSISGENVRINSGLHTTDNVEFASNTLNGNLSILDSNGSQKFSVDSDSGNAVVQGTLDSKGAFAVGNDQLTVQSDGTLETNSSISAVGALDAASANFGSVSNGVYDGGLNAGASNLASSTVHGALSHGGTDSSSALSSAFVSVSGGAINSTPIGATNQSTGAFTTLTGSSTMNIQSGALSVDSSGDVSMSGDLTISQNLTVNGSLVTIDTTNLVVEDSLIQLAKNNTITDNMDIGFVGQYGSTSGGSSDGDALGNSWSDVSSTDFSDGGYDYNYSATYSTSYGGSAKLAITPVSGGSGNSNRSKMSRDVDATGMNFQQSGNYTLTATINFPDLNGGSFSGRIAVWDYGTTSFGLYPDKYQPFGSGSLTSGDDVTLTFTADTDMASGVVLVVETWGGGSFGGIYVSDVHLKDPSGNTIFHQDGFEGSGGSSSTSTYYAGLVRDSSDSDKKFHLFTTSEDLSSSNSPTFTSGAGYSKATLVADIEGDLTGNADSADQWSSSRTVSFSGGDVSGSFSIDGSADVSNVDLTIGSGVVENSMLAGLISYDKIDFLNTSAALGTSDDVVPSQAAVKSYVDAAVSSGGLTDLEVGDMQMVHSDGGTLSFTKVKEIISQKTVSSDDQTGGYLTLSTAVESAFQSKSQVYLNGQKLRYSSNTGTNNDYWFSETSASATKYSNDLTASDSASNDFFGSGVGLSSDGTVLSVGASKWEGSSSDQGGVYIYDWNSSNEEWGQRGDVITAPDAEASDRFGESTSLNSDGSIMAAGAMFWDGNATNQGAAYVFEYNDTASFNSPTKYSNDLTASDQAGSDQYGRVSISQDGNVMSVGALLWDRSGGGSDHGGVYIYDWNSSTESWDQRGSVLSPTSDATSGVRFGTSTSLSSDGTYLAVGAILYTDTATHQGGAYVYKWNSSTSSWDKQGSTIVAGDAGASDYHTNVSISSDGTILSVGAAFWDGASGSNHGAVYTYDWIDTDSDGTADTWVQRSSGDNIVTNHDLSSGDLTGWTKQSGSNTTVDYFEYNSQDSIRLIPDNSTSSEGTWAAVSQNVNYNFQSGTTYKLKFDVLHYTNADRNIVYGIAEVDSNGDFSAWNTVYNLDVDDAVPGVSTSGEISMEWTADSDTSSVAQIRIHHGGDPLNQSGTIYVNNFRITDENDMVLTDNGGVLTASDSAAGDQFGRNLSLSSNGEILFVGAPYWEGSNTNQGGVYIYDWSSSNNSWVQRGDVLESNSPSSDGHFGFALETNGDGSVLSVTEYFASGNTNNVQLFDWNSSTSSWDYRTSISDHTTGTGNFGYTLSLSSDATKLAIGDAGNGSTVAGKVFTYSITENPVGWSQKGSTIYQSSATATDLHTHVSISGNGLVLAVGVYAYDGSLTDQGATYIYDWNSSTSDWDQRGSVLLPSDAAAYDYFGRDTSLSNDGSVLVIGSAEWEGNTSNQGGVYVFDWSDTDSDGTADSWVQRGDVLESNSPSANDYFGFSAQINSDATIMAVTKYQYANGGGDIGEVEIFDWNSSTSSWDYRYSIENPNGASSGTKNSTAFGYKVSLDGDGDFLVISERGTGYDNFAGRVQTYSLSSSSTNDKINFNSGTITEGDRLEIRYFIKS